MEAVPAVTLRQSHVWFGLMLTALLAALAWVIVLRRQMREKTRLTREFLRREAALRQRYFDLVENASDIVFTCTASGDITSLKSSAASTRATSVTTSR